jgi:hypothetical protein
MTGLSPAELRDLAIVRARAQFDRGDLAPMRHIYTGPAGLRDEEVIGWREAIEIEVGTDA